jgi:hypothetical protein
MYITDYMLSTTGYTNRRKKGKGYNGRKILLRVFDAPGWGFPGGERGSHAFGPKLPFPLA